ncbi:MAG TPA: hypothetical protein VMC07_00865 [Candidatus Omnitrophota bacterium]|nr:hypothetical protein [Candidatus Omnitrophota bacterium]
MNHKYSTIFLITLMVLGIIALVSSLESADIDEICNHDNMTLYRYSGTWGCGNLSELGGGNTANYYNITNQTIVYQNVSEIDPFWTLNYSNFTNIYGYAVNATSSSGILGLYKGYTIYSDDNYIYGIDNSGNIVAGGPNSINVTDSTDFGQIYASIVDFAFTPQNYDTGATVYLAPITGNHLQYIVKTPVVLTHCHDLIGTGRNKDNIYSANSTTMAGQILFTLRPSPSECYIQQIENVKFGMQPGYENQSNKAWYPLGYYNISNEAEIIVKDDEFRDTQKYSIYYDGNNAFNFNNYNYIINSWFLTGAGLYINNVGDLQLIGNKFTSGTNNTILNSAKVVEADNIILGGTYASPGVMNFTNDTFENTIFRGLVGINTSSPKNLLNIQGGSLNISAINPTWYMTNATGSIWTFWEDNSGNFRIDSAAGSTAFIIKRPGNSIGIGTTTPTQKLDVNGSINVSNGNVTLSNLMQLMPSTLPTCAAATNHTVGVNATGLYYCNSTGTWVLLAAG